MNSIAFCPAHLTGFFKADFGKREEKQEEIGSLGAGFSIENGVTTSVEIKRKKQQEKNFRIIIDGYQTENTNVSEFVINEFLKLGNFEGYFIEVIHRIDVPVGYGLGCSGAVALSLAFALNQALDLKLEKIRVGQIAHNAEIICQTGLGDVLASFYGGLEIRTKVGAPGIGKVEKIKTKSESVVVICFSPISTNEFMKKRIDKINGLGGRMVQKLIQSKNLNEFQDMSLEFAKYADLMTPQMQQVITDLQGIGIKCGIALFGETVFTLIPKNMETLVCKILKKYQKGIIIKSKIDNVGARLIH